MATTFRVGQLQLAGLQIYIFDPARAPYFDDEVPFPGELHGSKLTVTDHDLAWRMLTDAANESGDMDGDRPLSDALAALASRVLRAG
jgi:hypothetical protein